MISDDALLGAFQAPPAPSYANRPNAGEALAGIRPPRERRIRYGRSARDEHEWEWAAAELYRWERETPEKLAAAMMPTGRAPFTTAAPSAAQVEFWATRLILPDGSLNRPALDELLASASPAEVHALADGLRKRREAVLDETTSGPSSGQKSNTSERLPPSGEESYGPPLYGA
jgi:hypothetical protein